MPRPLYPPSFSSKLHLPARTLLPSPVPVLFEPSAHHARISLEKKPPASPACVGLKNTSAHPSCTSVQSAQHPARINCKPSARPPRMNIELSARPACITLGPPTHPARASLVTPPAPHSHAPSVRCVTAASTQPSGCLSSGSLSTSLVHLPQACYTPACIIPQKKTSGHRASLIKLPTPNRASPNRSTATLCDTNHTIPIDSFPSGLVNPPSLTLPASVASAVASVPPPPYLPGAFGLAAPSGMPSPSGHAGV